MQAIIIQEIKNIEMRKRKASQHPTHATLTELQAAVKQNLSRNIEAMIIAEMITQGNTINDNYLQLK